MSNETPKLQDIPNEIPIHFVKAAGFRVAHANGAWFGNDPQANLHLTFYNERSALPKTITVRLDEKGLFLGEDESKRESKTGIVREMEIDIVMSVEAATAFHEMLGNNLKIAANNLARMREISSI
jgi:hypothetical protein